MEKILDDINFGSEETRAYQDASKGTRFANYFVDGLVLWGAIELLTLMLPMTYFNTGNEFIFQYFIAILINWVFLVLIYTISEFYLKGKTPAKYLTKTRAVTVDNQTMDFNTALIRSLIRIVPFEAFSFLGSDLRGWHDRWSDTRVIMDQNWHEDPEL